MTTEYGGEFNAAVKKQNSAFAKMSNGTCLRYRPAGDAFNHFYDFVSRTLVVRAYSGEIAVLPFRDVDAELLAAMHAQLVRMGGNPPPLPMTQTSLLKGHAR